MQVLAGIVLAPDNMHLGRYIGEFVEHHIVRGMEALDQMQLLARNLNDMRLKYETLMPLMGYSAESGIMLEGGFCTVGLDFRSLLTDWRLCRGIDIGAAQSVAQQVPQ